MTIEDSDVEEKYGTSEMRVKESKKHWYLDNACSRHMTGDKKKLLSFSKISGGGFSFGDGKNGVIIEVEKIGTSESRALEDVYLVEGLKHNLLIISQLCDKGNKVIFTSTGVKVKRMDTKEVVLTAKRSNNVYKVDIMTMPETKLTFLSAIENDLLLWHMRLGHTSRKQLNRLSSKDMVLGLPKTEFMEERVCSACVREN
ncbi:uncharacterized protein LOC107848958 [Capsicum annuum]|uniref:uncharacterized protein LOC107848958 n=1 Tax=Capsicum annuum TaxID=4072 RepID=UPI0007BF99F8|nr:uncharacterized protein LOC107848958 [Capsicum annuum]